MFISKDMYINTCMYIISGFVAKRDLQLKASYWVAKIHRMPYLHRSFSAKEPYNLWLLCGK